MTKTLRIDSLYSKMVSEAANEEGSSELDIYLMEKPVPRGSNNFGVDYDVFILVEEELL